MASAHNAPVEFFGQGTKSVFLARAPLHALELRKMSVAHLIVPWEAGK